MQIHFQPVHTGSEIMASKKNTYTKINSELIGGIREAQEPERSRLKNGEGAALNNRIILNSDEAFDAGTIIEFEINHPDRGSFLFRGITESPKCASDDGQIPGLAVRLLEATGEAPGEAPNEPESVEDAPDEGEAPVEESTAEGGDSSTDDRDPEAGDPTITDPGSGEEKPDPGGAQ